ncbi:MAG: LysE/ArgO family amino acid transporter [Pseudomonadota bacterium]
MLTAALAGFSLGLSLILVIGPQNAFVLRQGLRREHVSAVALVCSLSDALLIIVGVGGLAAAQSSLPWLGPVMLYGGVGFLLWYGGRSALSALRPSNDALLPTDAPSTALIPTLLTCLALTWLNPHVYLDTVVFLGAVASQYDGNRVGFALGAIAASFLYFYALAYGARLLRPIFAKPVAWRVLDGFIAAVMWGLAVKLLTTG